MATGTLGGVVWHLRQAAFRSEAAASTDGELLDRFLADRDEAAFAALVRRHGPMVFGVCRRTLRNEADAEDAFQATFLVLARKADAVRPRDRVGYWLYGVAYNTARKARVSNRRRLARERRVTDHFRRTSTPGESDRLGEVLDIELNRLPDKYRETVVLCDVEGHALADAAQRLACPLGTVASRLARAREILRRNLSRRGLAAGAVAALLAPGAAAVSVSTRLIKTTALAATGAGPVSTHVFSLAEGVMHAMFLSKVKSGLAAVAAAAILVAGIGNGSALVFGGQEKPVKPPADSKTEKPVKPGADSAKPVKPGADPAKPGDKPTKPVNPDVKKLGGFSGTVKSVDAAKGSITISATKGDTSIDRTFEVAKEAHVSVDGKETNLNDVKAGLRANVKLSEDQKTAVAIGCEGPTVIGELKEVAADKKTLKVAVSVPTDKTDKTSPRKTEEQTIKVAEDARVIADGQKKATLSDLKAGSTVAVQISADGERAISIVSPAKGPAGPMIIGELKSVATDKKTLTVAVRVLTDKTDKTSAKIEEKTIKVADDARVVVDGNKQSTLADLKSGSSVAVQLSKDGEKAVAISSPAKGGPSPGGDKKPEKPTKPGAEKPTKPGGEKPDPVKPVKPNPDKP
jgi:RNA polymerase sigma factor (sigma-70 family)